MYVLTDCDIANITMVDTFPHAVTRTLVENQASNQEHNGIIFRYKSDILALTDAFLLLKMEYRNFSYIGLPRYTEAPEEDLRYQITITHVGKPKHLTEDWQGSNLTETDKVIKLGGSKSNKKEEDNAVGIDKDIQRQLAPSTHSKQQDGSSLKITDPARARENTQTGYEEIFNNPNKFLDGPPLTQDNSNPVPISSGEIVNTTQSRLSKIAKPIFDKPEPGIDPKISIAARIIKESTKDIESLKVLEEIKKDLTDLSFDGQNIFISLKGSDGIVKIGLLKSGKFRFTREDWEHLNSYSKYK